MDTINNQEKTIMTMNTYTTFEYILIATANAYGLDKKPFEERIQFMLDNGKRLRAIACDAEDYHLWMKGVMEIERCLNDRNYLTGLRVDLDATASGVQMLSVLCACITSASRVGLVDPTKRCDVYTDLQDFMNKHLPDDRQIGTNGSNFTRDDLKQSFMTHWYGSSAKPREVFGDGTMEYNAFYDSLEEMCPGVMELYNDIAGAVYDEATEYSWSLPDGAEITTPVMLTVDKRVKVEELGSSFTHRMQVNLADDKYCAVLANVTHSVDGMMIRECCDRIDYNQRKVTKLRDSLVNGTAKSLGMTDKNMDKLNRMINIATESKFVSARFTTMFNEYNAGMLPDWLKDKVIELCNKILAHPRSPMSSVHDAFGVLPYACNGLRYHYADVLACVAESDTCQFILRGLYNDKSLRYTKQTNGKELAVFIRNSNYSLS